MRAGWQGTRDRKVHIRRARALNKQACRQGDETEKEIECNERTDSRAWQWPERVFPANEKGQDRCTEGAEKRNER